MGDFFYDAATSGTLLLAIPVALLAGLISFFSPCCIPLLPGYLAYATGLSGADLATGDLSGGRRGRMLLGSVLFVLGFSAVFVALGTVFGALGSLGEQLLIHRDTLSFVLGFVVILMGVVFLGLVPFLQRDVRVHTVPAVGLAAAPLLGFLFGLGWTPCLGPTMVAITSLSFNEATAGRGALLSGAYALGLGLPFLVAGLTYRWALGMFSAVRRHQAWVTRAGGVMLVVVGVAMVTGWWDWAVQWLQLQVVGRVETVA
jgi:cytochrome c-type biogenesis protein